MLRALMVPVRITAKNFLLILQPSMGRESCSP